MLEVPSAYTLVDGGGEHGNSVGIGTLILQDLRISVGIVLYVGIPGLGFLTAVAPLFFANEKYGVTKFVPDISTNNLPVLGLYDYFKFNVEELTYVFVKHQ